MSEIDTSTWIQALDAELNRSHERRFRFLGSAASAALVAGGLLAFGIGQLASLVKTPDDVRTAEVVAVGAVLTWRALTAWLDKLLSTLHQLGFYRVRLAGWGEQLEVIIKTWESMSPSVLGKTYVNVAVGSLTTLVLAWLVLDSPDGMVRWSGYVMLYFRISLHTTDLLFASIAGLYTKDIVKTLRRAHDVTGRRRIEPNLDSFKGETRAAVEQAKKASWYLVHWPEIDKGVRSFQLAIFVAWAGLFLPGLGPNPALLAACVATSVGAMVSVAALLALRLYYAELRVGVLGELRRDILVGRFADPGKIGLAYGKLMNEIQYGGALLVDYEGVIRARKRQ